jgi:hypothetical protein
MISRTTLLVTAIALAGCKHHADPRLAGTWDLVVDPQYPPRVGFAVAHSGTFVFDDDVATRTLAIETADHQRVTVVTRYLDWHIDDENGWFAYTTDDASHTDTEVSTSLKGDGLSIMDLESLATMDYKRRTAAAR